MLVDRETEVDALERLLAAAREGLSGVLVLTGEAGIGKTVLLEHVAEMAHDMRIRWVAGVESEMDLGFAGLHQLLVPFLDGLAQLPEPQRQALESAFGWAEAGPPDRFLVGLASLTLLTDAAAGQPVLCLIDDAQWLDRVSAEVLGFVARRLLADRVGMVFAVDDGERAVPLEGLSVLRVDRLPHAAASELLAAAGPPLEHPASERIMAEAEGNPLALVEFAAEAANGQLTDGEIGDEAAAGQPLRFRGRLQELYASRVRALPAEAQTLLAVAAADQLGEPGKVSRAAAYLGIGPEVAELPAVQRLVSWEPRVRFRNPLVRSAAYYAATTVARREAHAALAAVSDPELDPDRRAWHAAAAEAAPDERIAAALERSADRARARGGWASGAAFLERAAALTPEEDQRARRLLAAAQARLVGGDAPAARTLLEHAAPHLADPADVARARRLDGLTLYAAGQPSEATTALLVAARRLQPFDARLASDTLLDAFGAAQFSARPGARIAEVAAAVRAAPGLPGAETTVAALLDGFAALHERRFPAAADLLRRAIVSLTSSERIPDGTLPHFLAIATAAAALYDDEARHQIEHWWVAELRERGALSALLAALSVQMEVQVEEGRFEEASATLAEGRALSEATGYHAYLASFTIVELHALAWQGREADARPLAGRLLREFAQHSDGSGLPRVHKALAKLELGLGNYAEALGHALETLPQQAVPGLGAVADAVEAGTRSAQQEAAVAALAEFTPWAQATGSDWALGLLARSRALLADDDQAEPQYRLAIEHLRQTFAVPDLARAHLLYGEWLRRQRRRKDARDHLRVAHGVFDRLGMVAFADRARHELRATGEQARKRVVDTAQVLTPQEAQIAKLAADGVTNSEIAAKLFLSASTVEYHLRKVFRKLGVTSRVQLSRLLGERERELAPQHWPARLPSAARR